MTGASADNSQEHTSGGDAHEDLHPQTSKRRRVDTTWSWTVLDTATKFVPPQQNFLREPMITASLPTNASPLDFFKLYVTDDIVDMIVQQTNLYAAQYIANNTIPPHSAVNQWRDTDRDEMYTFFGLIVLMGIVFKPRLAMYWSTDELYETGIFGKSMARDRFMLLLRFLHFVNNDTIDPKDPNRDRLAKIRNVMNLLRRRFATVFAPGRDLCVDESLLLFKGRLAFKQFIRTKRARFGIKIFELCTHNGILLDFAVYHGQFSRELDADQDMLISERIPVSLMKQFLDQGHRLFLDNYYTSPKLVKYFLSHNTRVVGTVRSNRQNFPPALANASLQRGEAKFALADEGIIAVKYRAHQDRANKQEKVVCLLSADHGNDVVETRKRTADGQKVLKPSCVVDYNCKMGGVDMVDQQLESVLVVRRSYKWYKKLFFRLLMQALLSAHKLYQLCGGRDDFLRFLHNVIMQLLAHSARLTPTAKSLDGISRLTGRNHFPSQRQYTGTSRKRASKKKQCRVCYARGVRTPKGGVVETTWVCEGCPSVPGLCVDKTCFRDYHTKFDYSVV